MSTSSPLVFHPSALQRGMALLLCAGSWLVGARALASLLQEIPHLHTSIQEAHAAGENPWGVWILMILAIAAVVLGSLILMATILGLVLIEGTEVLVDQMGIAVQLAYLPSSWARWLGAGRLPWKRVGSLTRRGPFFVLAGDAKTPGQDAEKPLPTLRFLMVDELEHLVNLIFQRSPNISFKD